MFQLYGWLFFASPDPWPLTSRSVAVLGLALFTLTTRMTLWSHTWAQASHLCPLQIHADHTRSGLQSTSIAFLCHEFLSRSPAASALILFTCLKTPCFHLSILFPLIPHQFPLPESFFSNQAILPILEKAPPSSPTSPTILLSKSPLSPLQGSNLCPNLTSQHNLF